MGTYNLQTYNLQALVSLKNGEIETESLAWGARPKMCDDFEREANTE